jgi:hypothetical protein
VKHVRIYFKRVYRVRRNTSPVRGAYRCDLGYWIPSGVSPSRDRFNVIRTIEFGSKRECQAAGAQCEAVADAKR